MKVRYTAPDGDASRLPVDPVPAALTGAPSEDLRFASAVAGFGMLLRSSKHRGTLHTARVLDLAESAIGRDAAGYRREFLEMVQMYRLITEGTSTESESR